MFLNRGDHPHHLDVFPIGKTSSRFECGLGITCTLINSPTRRAAAAPASVAAFTAATSPRTIAVTYPEPIFSHPTRFTFAALTIASAASIIAISPRVSIIPKASPIIWLSPSLAIYGFLSSPNLSQIRNDSFDQVDQLTASERD